MKTRVLFSLIAMVLTTIYRAEASAQPYPLRPITIVVPLAAGGPNDTLARILAESMRMSLGQPVIVENVTGAAGTVGTGRVARAPPDGYTIGMGFLGTHVLNGAIYSLPYDVVTDFEPIALVSSNPHLIVTKAALPAMDLRELIGWLKPTRIKRRPPWPVSAPVLMLPAFCSSNSLASDFSWCLIVAPHRPCRMSWRVRSISWST